ncbi:General transcription factor IIH subunit 2 [Cymbomonas tetramitiformis]|uniref:General transcription factor IIH subunit 2 n=1 Tax=Cymbomonas tetramitiformis TaxID=36881 RepID=A0AAE0ESR4_9CHLO|nr:General transcription factor IIH subunit 2 [Cymbomonas tetramitiformis]
MNHAEVEEVEEEVNADEAAAEREAYERAYADERSWEELEEDEHGILRPIDHSAQQRLKRQRLVDAAQSARIRRGMIRYVYLVLDVSRAILMTDFRPTRLSVVSGIVQCFVKEFFDQNPLSQLGLILARNGIAERVTELSGSPEAHLAALRNSLKDPGGDISLQNALEAARMPLSQIPPYGTREIIIVLSGLSTCDPGDIFTTIEACSKGKVRCSVVGVAAEMNVCRKLSVSTGGEYGVATSPPHLQELLMAHACPPPSLAEHTRASLVNMGFAHEWSRALRMSGAGLVHEWNPGALRMSGAGLAHGWNGSSARQVERGFAHEWSRRFAHGVDPGRFARDWNGSFAHEWTGRCAWSGQELRMGGAGLCA